jgi:MFS transporter, DHA3 family, macrolide efflux protein
MSRSEGPRTRWRDGGVAGYAVILGGQAVSEIGTRMTTFALAWWAWQLTGAATPLTLMLFFATAPSLLLSPFAGVIVDRFSRRVVLLVSDAGAALGTVAILLLFAVGRLEIWHVYAAQAVSSCFQAFQMPAFQASATLMLPKRAYARAAGFTSLVHSSATLLGPLAAVPLIGLVDVGGVLAADLATFAAAACTLALVRVPRPPADAEPARRPSIWRQASVGFAYIFGRPGLLGLQASLSSVNLLLMLAFSLTAPLVLARTGGDRVAFGSVQAALGLGGIVGGALLVLWGGPRRKVHGVYGSMLLQGILGVALFGLGRAVPWWVVAGFFITFFTPIVNGSNQAIWQAKVPPGLQGRVFSARRVLAQVTVPLAMLAAGPLADRVLEPGLAPGGPLVPFFGGLVGTGPGAGMAVLFVFCGLAGSLVGASGYLLRSIREVEERLPDYDAAAPPAAAGPAQTPAPLPAGPKTAAMRSRLAEPGGAAEPAGD